MTGRGFGCSWAHLSGHARQRAPARRSASACPRAGSVLAGAFRPLREVRTPLGSPLRPRATARTGAQERVGVPQDRGCSDGCSDVRCGRPWACLSGRAQRRAPARRSASACPRTGAVLTGAFRPLCSVRVPLGLPLRPPGPARRRASGRPRAEAVLMRAFRPSCAARVSPGGSWALYRPATAYKMACSYS